MACTLVPPQGIGQADKLGIRSQGKLKDAALAGAEAARSQPQRESHASTIGSVSGIRGETIWQPPHLNARAVAGQGGGRQAPAPVQSGPWRRSQRSPTRGNQVGARSTKGQGKGSAKELGEPHQVRGKGYPSANVAADQGVNSQGGYRKGSGRFQHRSVEPPRAGGKSRQSTRRNQSVQPARDDPLKVAWVCRECQSYFDTYELLADHQQSDGHWNPTMEHCGRVFVKESEFAAHVDAGNGERSNSGNQVDCSEPSDSNCQVYDLTSPTAEGFSSSCPVFDLTSPTQQKFQPHIVVGDGCIDDQGGSDKGFESKCQVYHMESPQHVRDEGKVSSKQSPTVIWEPSSGLCGTPTRRPQVETLAQSFMGGSESACSAAPTYNTPPKEQARPSAVAQPGSGPTRGPRGAVQRSGRSPRPLGHGGGGPPSAADLESNWRTQDLANRPLLSQESRGGAQPAWGAHWKRSQRSPTRGVGPSSRPAPALPGAVPSPHRF
mmetsp:Transcript_69426/g.174994  ORF Transcript_69426/g.174994 Transcript_69426/m.174994 type:complete len:492 (-) Transcript_69426:77-1552(-)